ncbi:MAG: tRNA lysidine(34) synthetase TilS [Synergistaceae bacterium]|jgi:tRNA(Ile)-lysidine synthase|nr:tRNA lysidine(34) synthetase TilS [Synergistaceae bacterium]
MKGPGDAVSFYRKALSRLSPEDREREGSRDIPYVYSLSALSDFFFKTGKRQGWQRDDETSGKKTVVLAVSGGGDSMALLWLFRTFYDGKVVAAHLEHGIRGQDSLSDARFVEEMAARWGLDAEIQHLDVPMSLRKGESLEAGARRLRYAFLESVAEARGAFGVALGHNRDDVAETVLFNLLRGSGVRGVTGMPERRGIFFRPLLSCSRAFLRALLSHRRVPWREDLSNSDNDCTRNFIRNELLPLLTEKINAKASDHLVAFAEEMRYYREEEEVRGAALLEAARINERIDDSEPHVTEEGLNGMRSVDREKLRALSPWERAVLVREAGRRLEIPTLSRERSKKLACLIEGRGQFEFQWGEGVSVLGSKDRISWAKVGTNGKNSD